MLLKKKLQVNTSLISILRLVRSETIGPITYKKLVHRFGSPEKALELLPDLSKAGGGKPFAPVSASEAEAELEKLTKSGGHIITYKDEAYPETLRAIEDAPILLSVIGDVSLLNKKQIGIVGSRNASLNGKKLTTKLARDVGERGFVVTSGMARGIDTAAHEGALVTGTIAVVAGGIDQIYPRENTKLYHMLCEKGVVITESAFGAAPSAHLFPRRNRIVSGMSLGVVVVEASERSGSLITARLAGEQGREVMAIPGYPSDPRAAGPNKLIRDGAVLVRHADDIIEAVEGFRGLPNLFVSDNDAEESFDNNYLEEFSDVEKASEMILDQLTSQMTGIDELLRACHLSVSEGQTALLALELAGKIQRLPGNRLCRLEE